MTAPCRRSGCMHDSCSPPPPPSCTPPYRLAFLQALQRADQIEYAEGKVTKDYFLPIVADAGELV